MDFKDDEEITAYYNALVKKQSDIPIWEKKTLSIDEAAAYSGIGRKNLRVFARQKGCPFVIWKANKAYILREMLEKYMEKAYKI